MQVDFEKLKSIVDTTPGFRPAVFVDVDNTLIDYMGSPIEKTVALVKSVKERFGDGVSVVVWSTAGREYAARAVARCGLSRDVDCVLSKPVYIVDDLKEHFLMNMATFVSPFENFDTGAKSSS